MVQVQTLGDVDCLLRSMEAETKQRISQPREVDAVTLEDIAFSYVVQLSRLWILDAYEFVRTIQEVEGYDSASPWHEPYRLLTLVRVPLAKHQLPYESKIPNPLEMAPFPQNGVRDDTTYIYDPKDRSRSHIPAMAVNPNSGSCEWFCIDFKKQEQFWISRKQISDLILSINKN